MDVIISNTMPQQQRYFSSIDTSWNEEEMLKIGQALFVKARRKKEFTETGQQRSGPPPQLPGVSCLTPSVHRHLYAERRPQHHPQAGPVVSQNLKSHICHGRPQIISKSQQYFPSLPTFRNGDELGHERIVSNYINFQLVPLKKDSEA